MREYREGPTILVRSRIAGSAIREAEFVEEWVTLQFCKECGTLVWETAYHDRWHIETEQKRKRK